MSVPVSVVIRAKNEEKWIGEVLKKIFQQTYKSFEVIVIDSGSTDKTLDIVRKFPVKLLQIPSQDFSYPYALNYAIKRSSCTKYVVILSAHSIPISDTWLEDGIKNFSDLSKIMGVYGIWKPLPHTSYWDRFFINFHFYSFFAKNKSRIIQTKAKMGVLQFTNAIILKKLWDKRHFNEEYGLGGEDGEWAGYWMKREYRVVLDKNFTVKHSHNLSLWGWNKQFEHWYETAKPAPFKPLAFRKSSTHS